VDYNSLVTQIQNYANRSDQDFVNQIPQFIEYAIKDIYSVAKHIGFEIIINGNLVQGNPTLAKPGNWKETISFQVTDNRPNPAVSFFLEPRVYEYCNTYWPSNNVQAKPKYYADVGYGLFYIAATPDYNYPCTITYRGLPDFSPQNPVNFLTQNYPFLLLSGSLYQMISYLKDDERSALFEKMYEKAVVTITSDSRKLDVDRTSKRDVN
jgi:hypothetical protein